MGQELSLADRRIASVAYLLLGHFLAETATYPPTQQTDSWQD
jgi:hypothetical protein